MCVLVESSQEVTCTSKESGMLNSNSSDVYACMHDVCRSGCRSLTCMMYVDQGVDPSHA